MSEILLLRPLRFMSERTELNEFLSGYDLKYRAKRQPPDWLKDAESPFKWLTSLRGTLTVRWNIAEKLEDYKNQGADYGYEKFTLLLPLLVKVKILQPTLSSSEDDSSTDDDSSSDDSSSSDRTSDGAGPNSCLIRKRKGKNKSDKKISSEVEERENDCDKETNNESEENKDGQEKNDNTKEGEENNCDEESSNTKSKTEYTPEKCYEICKETLDEMAAREGDVMYKRIGAALEHVLQAARAHMLYLVGEVDKSKEIAKKIQPVREMSRENLAGIEGIKAKFILSIYQDIRLALEASMRAVELDPDFGAWHYLTGKIIRRLRKSFNEDITTDEITYFEKAVELERNPKFLVFLGQAYQEMALFLFYSRIPDVNNVIREKLRKAVDLYRECWSLKNDSAAISRRVGNGMLKMRPEFMDLVLAKEALLKAVELSPNSVTYHALGKFYYIHEKDDEKALKTFEKCGVIFGESDIVRINLIKDKDYDPLELILHWEKHATHIVKRDLLLCGIGWYYLVFKRDLNLSVLNFWEILKRDYKSFRVLEFQNYAFCVRGPLNMIEILVNEILLEKNKNDALPTEERKDISFILSFLDRMLEKHPQLKEMDPNPELLENIIRDNKREISFLRKKRYGNFYKYQNEVFVNWRNEQVQERQGVDMKCTKYEFKNYDSWRNENENSKHGHDENRENGCRSLGRERHQYGNKGDDNNESIREGMRNWERERRQSKTSNSGDNEGNRNEMTNWERGRGQYVNSNRSGYNEDTRNGLRNWERGRSQSETSNSSDHGENRNELRNWERERRYGNSYSSSPSERSRDSKGWKDGVNSRYEDSRRDNRRYGMNAREDGSGRGAMRRQYNNRYDVTITDWRSEQRN